MNRIAWTNTGYHGEPVGHITVGDARIKIASVSWSTKHRDPKPWVLRTQIPGFTNARHYETRDKAYAACEQMLTTFVTAMRPPAPEYSEVFQSAQNAWKSGYSDQPWDGFLQGFRCAVNWMNGGRG
jgi:hypothetical protein